jgi:hypothetical protein
MDKVFIVNWGGMIKGVYFQRENAEEHIKRISELTGVDKRLNPTCYIIDHRINDYNVKSTQGS